MKKRITKLFVITAAVLVLFSACTKNTSFDSEDIELFFYGKGFNVYDVTDELYETFEGYAKMVEYFERDGEGVFLVQFYDLDYARIYYNWTTFGSTIETIADGYNYGRAIVLESDDSYAYFSFVNENVVAYFYDEQASTELMSLINQMGY